LRKPFQSQALLDEIKSILATLNQTEKFYLKNVKQLGPAF